MHAALMLSQSHIATHHDVRWIAVNPGGGSRTSNRNAWQITRNMNTSLDWCRYALPRFLPEGIDLP